MITIDMNVHLAKKHFSISDCKDTLDFVIVITKWRVALKV